MKETGLIYWDAPNTGATNSSGFSARAAGEWENDVYQFEGRYCLFWTSSEGVSGGAYYYYLSHDDARIALNEWGKDLAYSVRCVKDAVTESR